MHRVGRPLKSHGCDSNQASHVYRAARDAQLRYVSRKQQRSSLWWCIQPKGTRVPVRRPCSDRVPLRRFSRLCFIALDCDFWVFGLCCMLLTPTLAHTHRHAHTHIQQHSKWARKPVCSAACYRVVSPRCATGSPLCARVLSSCAPADKARD